MRHRPRAAPLLLFFALAATPVAAQEQDDDRPRRTRVTLGPQLVPDYPGATGVVLRPYIDVSRARGDDPFAFEAADENAGFTLLRNDGFSFGPSLGFEGRRTRADTDGALAPVGFSFELGGFAQYQVHPSVRLRVEARHGVSGHEGFVANLSGDYIARDADRWLFSLGPRVTLTNARYQRAYFGIGATDAAAAGVRAFRPDGGLQSVGASAGLLRQLTPRFGLIGYTKYDRLVADAADSPVVRSFGSRNQFSGGVALSYMFGAVRD